jgi:hypothetical protein
MGRMAMFCPRLRPKIIAPVVLLRVKTVRLTSRMSATRKAPEVKAMPASHPAIQSDLSTALVSSYAEGFHARFGAYAFEKAFSHLRIAVLEGDVETSQFWLQVAQLIAGACLSEP